MPGNTEKRRPSYKELEQSLIEQIAISVLNPNSSQNSSRRNSGEDNVLSDEYDRMTNGLKSLKAG